MITFPSATRVHKRLPKEAFYKHLPLTQVLKDAFVSDIDRIYVEWSLTKENLHLQKVGDVKEILVMILEMRNAGISVITTKEYGSHFAMIDNHLVWYGGMNLLGKDIDARMGRRD